MYERSSSPQNVKVVRTQYTSGAGVRSIISSGSRPPPLIIENRSKLISYGSRGKQYTSEISGINIEDEQRDLEEGLVFVDQIPTSPKCELLVEWEGEKLE